MMTRDTRFTIFALGIGLTLTSFALLVGAFLFNPGPPYQDATPQQLTHYEHQSRISEWSCFTSGILFPLGVITAAISPRFKPKPTV